MKNLVLGLCVIAFGVGVAWRSVMELSWAWSVWLLLLALVLGLIRRHQLVHDRLLVSDTTRPLLLLSLVFIYLALGIVRTEVYSWQFGHAQLAEQVGSELTITGVIDREPDYRANSVHLYIETGDDLLLVTTDRFGDYRYGDRVTVSGELGLPEEFETELGRTFDYPGYLLARGVEYRMFFAEVDIIERDTKNLLIGGLLSLKQRFIDSMQQTIPEPQAGLGAGLLLGVQSGLGDDIEEDFRRTGIIHIVVLSGYNVMLVVAFIMLVFSFFMSLRWRVFFGIGSIIAFALIVGLSATVVRASIMAALVLLAQVLGREYDVLRALLIAGWVMIVLNPYLLVYDIGFQLSFMATLGLVLVAPHFESALLQEKQSWWGWRGFLLATVATQIAVLPLLMYHIGEVSLIAVLVNVLVLPIVPAAMLLTFLSGVIGFVSIPLATLIGYVANFSLGFILQVANWFANVPYATVPVPEFGVVIVLLLYLVFGICWYILTHRPFSFTNKSLHVTENLSEWTIEEETDILQPAQMVETKKSALTDEDSADDLPIFFR